MNVLDTLFGPVSKKYCSLFYYLAIGSFVMYLISLVSAIAYGIAHSKGVVYYISTIVMALVYLLIYFQNRLLFSMCSR